MHVIAIRCSAIVGERHHFQGPYKVTKSEDPELAHEHAVNGFAGSRVPPLTPNCTWKKRLLPGLPYGVDLALSLDVLTCSTSMFSSDICHHSLEQELLLMSWHDMVVS